MNEFISSVLGGPLYLKVTSGILFLLVVIFLAFFLSRGSWHWSKLGKILKGIRQIDANAKPEQYRSLFEKDKKLVHLWDEYADTLHEQKEDRGGLSRTIAWRATVPSETFFNSQYVVDSRLGTEFFKHLPGIFTGIGIIGTFFGLIDGLQNFQVSADPAKTIEGIKPLMDAVREAFLISASAITAAMFVTFFEKILVNGLYTRTEEISHAIDAHFDVGAGEEYLSRLVVASEDSASQSKILKDALVTELGDILREISGAQTAAVQASNRDLGGMISGSIETSLKEPLSRIESAFKEVQGGQSDRTVRMLGDVMSSFSAQLNDLFGGQITGINELSRQSADTMKEAVASLKTLVGELGDTGKNTTDQMAAKMAASIDEMDRRQADINARTESLLSEVSNQMSSVMASFAQSHSLSLSANQEREKEMAGRASSLVENLTGSVEAVIQEISDASQSMARSVERLSSATTSSIDKMNVGADKISTASIRFVESGAMVSEVMDKAASVSNKLTEISGQMSVSSSSLEESMRDYRTQRQAVVEILESTKTTIELARKEAGITENVLQRIEASSKKLAEVQVDFDKYLDGVSNILVESTNQFNSSVKSTLQEVNTDFHEHLGKSVRLLKDSVDELEVTLSSVGSRP